MQTQKEKNITTKHIRQQLELLYQQKYSNQAITKKKKRNYNGLGLNWRSAVILVLVLFYVGLYQVQAHAQETFNLNDIDTAMMLSYQKQSNNYQALTLLSSDYNVDITGIVASVHIKQTFVNATNEWIDEGMYAFPVDEKATVYRMKLILSKRVIEGEIHEKKQAQAIYKKAKSEGLSASIVKQYRPNLFTTDVANIMPHEQVSVEISYQQTLKFEAGHIDFRLPLAIKSRYMQKRFLADTDTETNLQAAVLANPIVNSNIQDDKNRRIHINLEAGFELSKIKSLYHDVDIQQSNVFHSITLKDKKLYDNNDFVLRWQPTAGNEPMAAMFSEKHNGEEYVLMMLLPPKQQVKSTSLQRREVVFIIDTSGSMQGQAINAAKDALLFALSQLDKYDKFNVIEFNSNASELFQISKPANNENITLALDFIDRLKANGGTNMSPALALAMNDKVNSDYLKQIIFITDGSIGNEAEIFSQINRQIDKARLFTVAIGSAPNNYFMKKAALIGRGTYTSITNLSEVDTQMNELFVKLSSPALTDIFVQWNTNAEQNPRIIPDLYSDEPIIVTAKMSKFDTQVAISGLSANKTWSKPFEFYRDGHSKGIAKLWARNQIEDLTDDLMLNSNIDRNLLQQQITDIALKYHLVSQFTSLVAVDKTPEQSRLVAIQRRAEAKANIIAQSNFPQTALGWQGKLLFGLILLSFAFFFHPKFQQRNNDAKTCS